MSRQWKNTPLCLLTKHTQHPQMFTGSWKTTNNRCLVRCKFWWSHFFFRNMAGLEEATHFSGRHDARPACAPLLLGRDTFHRPYAGYNEPNARMVGRQNARPNSQEGKTYSGDVRHLPTVITHIIPHTPGLLDVSVLCVLKSALSWLVTYFHCTIFCTPPQ